MVVYFSSTFLMTASAINCQAREIKNREQTPDRFNRLLINTCYSLALGVLTTAAIQLKSSSILENKVCVISLVVSLIVSPMISGLAYLARSQNILADPIENIDKNFAKYADLISCISSVALVTLIALRNQEPIVWLTIGCVALNLTYYLISKPNV